MELQRSDPDEPPAPAPFLPPPPPPFWLQQPPLPPPQPQSSYCDFTEQRTTQAGCRDSGFRLDSDYLNNVEYIGQGIGRASENFQILHSNHKEIQRDLENETRKSCINPGFGIGYNVDMLYNVNPETQRDIEKKKIREEIIAAEMARRRELEAEVREELRIEREMALRMKGGDKAFDKVHVLMESMGKFLMQEAVEKLAMYVEERLRIQGRTETNGMDLLPSHRTSLESKVNETHQEKAKPSADLSATQREALAPAKNGAYTVFGVWGVGNIEGKKDWRCFICQVSATNEVDLKEHFNGKKHKSKIDALKAEKAVLLPTVSPIVAAKPLDGNTASMLPEKNKAKGSGNIEGKKDWRCFICQVSATSEVGLEEHFNGKKHKSKRDALKAEKAVLLPTASPIVAAKPLEGNTASMLPEKNNAKGSGSIEGKKDWRCFICQVGATSAVGLEEHFNGKKHKSNRDALKAEKAVLLPTASPIVAAKPLDGNTASMLPEKSKEKGSEKFAFWCDMCNAGANNKYLMEAHKKGKKHLKQLKKKFAFWCDACNVGAHQANVMEAHLKGKKHLSSLQEKTASTTSE